MDFKPQEPLLACVGKDPFDSYGQAVTIAEKTKRNKTRANISAYRCEHCGKFHIGSSFVFKSPKKGVRGFRRKK